MFKREIRPLPESVAEAINKSINKLQYVEEKASRPADRTEGDEKTQDITGEEPVKTDGSATKAPARKGDQSGAEPMQKVKEEVELDEANKNIIPDRELNNLVKSKKAVFWKSSGFDKLPNDKFFYIPILDKNKKMLGVYKANANDSDQEYEYLDSMLKDVREEVELDEAVMKGNYARVLYNYREDYYYITVYKNGKEVASDDGYFGANETGNPLIKKFTDLVKKAGLKPEGLPIVDEDGKKGMFKGNTFKWNVKESIDEAVNVKAIQKAVDDGKSMDVIMTMFANKRTTNTDEIRKVVQDYKWKKRMKKEEVEITELHMSLLEAHGIEKKMAEKIKKVFDAMSTADKAAFMKSYLKNPKAATEYMADQIVKGIKAAGGMNLGEAMDPVDPKALKGKHSERKDKDIDNDGDIDSSDEYLHKRRQAISKAMKKEEVDSSTGKKLDEVSKDLLGRYATKAHNRGDMAARMSNHGRNQDMANIANKRYSGVQKAISKLSGRARVNATEEAKQVDEAVEISHDRYMSSHGKKAKGSGQWAFTTKSKGEPNKNEMVFVSGDLTSAAKEAAKKLGANRVYVMEQVELDEAYTINHKTFSSAVQHAKAQAEKQGYTIDDDEWDRKVAMGPKKPGTGKTNRYTIDLMKGGKETRRKLQMQVYYDEGRYELNMYIS